MDGLPQLIAAIQNILFSWQVVDALWATLLGIIVGMTPGLTATLGVALLTTLTFTMEPDNAILVLVCMYIGAIYGGSRTAILLNIPGTPANAATSLDGYPLARSGHAGKAMAVATTGSFMGSMIGMVALAVVAPWLAEFALEFGSFEFFWLAVFGVVIAGQLTAFDDPIRGWISGFFGLLIAMVGQESIHAYQRFVYGWSDLSGGFGLLPVLVGAFGFSEIISVMRQESHVMIQSKVSGVMRSALGAVRYVRTWVRSGIIGTFMGIVPGVGEDMGAWVSYAAARRVSRDPDSYGKGSTEGLVAAETGNNAAVPGALIPVLTLAIPGSAPAAVLLAAMVIHGIRPGPLIMIQQPEFFYQVVAMVFVATCCMLVLGLALIRPMLFILKVRREWLMGSIFVLCAVGAYAIAGRLFDVWVMLAFGVLGFVMREMRFPLAPMILGVVLGPILDANLRRSLVLTDGDLAPFFMRPISAVLWITILTLIIVSLPPVQRWFARLRGPRPSDAAPDPGTASPRTASRESPRG